MLFQNEYMICRDYALTMIENGFYIIELLNGCFATTQAMFHFAALWELFWKRHSEVKEWYYNSLVSAVFYTGKEKEIKSIFRRAQSATAVFYYELEFFAEK